eukprot:scaffold32502_cov26-Tisochrysis_lutea.AAC.1
MRPAGIRGAMGAFLLLGLAGRAQGGFLHMPRLQVPDIAALFSRRIAPTAPTPLPPPTLLQRVEEGLHELGQHFKLPDASGPGSGSVIESYWVSSASPAPLEDPVPSPPPPPPPPPGPLPSPGPTCAPSQPSSKEPPKGPRSSPFIVSMYLLGFAAACRFGELYFHRKTEASSGSKGVNYPYDPSLPALSGEVGNSPMGQLVSNCNTLVLSALEMSWLPLTTARERRERRALCEGAAVSFPQPAEW